MALIKCGVILQDFVTQSLNGRGRVPRLRVPFIRIRERAGESSYGHAINFVADFDGFDVSDLNASLFHGHLGGGDNNHGYVTAFGLTEVVGEHLELNVRVCAKLFALEPRSLEE